MFFNIVYDCFYFDYCDVFYLFIKIREVKVMLIILERIKIVCLCKELVFEVGVIGLYMLLDGKKFIVNDIGMYDLFVF